ncbi:ABC transporter ATP-binding protein [Saccharicrinis fermentans]|uniref:Putative multidrug export ATP-binding/permease protein n=1 Tax=Saccharicrinis fermentans DSM 9555 = JCM 21142 TaxID=869213 RepID=W7YTF7_9BACT|nr:ABC transporter ATP-binding protein [Saccharicrinis fermentans]GAF05724.1 putative multidrug export ATP-binding/permease protein [Saccharicrinis fermentans DSM 9555 = JCM 21142]
MKDFFKVLRRFIPPYKRHLVLSFVFNVLHSVFGSIAMLFSIPIFQVLFDKTKEVSELVAWELTQDAVVNNFYYFVTQFKNEYGIMAVMPLVGVLLLFATFLKVSFSYLASHQTVSIRNGVVKDMRMQIFAKLIALPLGFYSDEKKGDVMARATGDVTEVENSIMSSLDMLIKNPIIILVSVGFMLSISFQLTLFVFVMLPIAGWVIGKTGKSLKTKSRVSQSLMGSILGTIEETIGGLRIVKAFNAEDRMMERFEKEAEDYKRIMDKVRRRYVMAHPLSEFLGTIVVVVLVWFGSYIATSENSTFDGASFIAYLGIFYQIINPAKQFSTAFFNIQKGLAAMERIDKILLADNKILEQDGAKKVKSFRNIIEYKNVSFGYNEHRVLKNVSLSIEKGKMVALVGQSGSGKTTFVDLLPRFHDIQEGSITIDGVDIRDMRVHDLRGLMGNVNQEAILFNDTFFNNIAFGVRNASREQVEKAAKVANAHDFISASEHGYQTLVGDRGGKLSGGQRQRISIARAVLKNPDILILDEATSALDTESEKMVQEALENLMNSRTSIVIAHRLSTVRNADLICVFSEGEIVEKGSHEELLAQGGTYSKLHELQVR